MIDLARLERITLSPRPLGQRVVGALLIGVNYRIPGRRTHVVIEGRERIPVGGGAIFVMNHTDRYNYWPFQYALWKQGIGFTATWVKGKYYENPVLGWFMDACNNIPLPSKGYVLTKDFQRAMGRLPHDDEYAALKQFVDGQLDPAAARARGGEGAAAFLACRFDDSPTGSYLDSLERRYDAMMRRVVELSRQALALGLDLLIFPQGTRSIRLTAGHPGAAQLALATGAPVLPVGCNGSDKLYPGNSPWSGGGTVVYRVGEPLTAEGELARFRIPTPFVPFTREAEAHAFTFRAVTELFMERINELLDPPYRFAEGEGGTRGAHRFV